MSDHLQSNLIKKIVISATVSVSVGFGFGFLAHAVWRRFHQSPSIPPDFVKELSSLKSEIAELKQLFASVANRRASNQYTNDLQTFYWSDEEDEFFDIENSQFSAQLAATPLSQEIKDELDRLAAIAMGEECILATSTPKVGAGGDENKPGSQAYAKCLVYRKAYRRCPEFLWRYARATYLASTEATNDEDDAALGALNDPNEGQSDITSVSSSRTLNDLAYELTSRRQFVEHGLVIARRALSLAKRLQDSEQQSCPPLEPGVWAEIYKWLAVMTGLACEFVGMKQRITYGVEFKELIDKAIEMNPNDCHSHHLRGRWAYQVYNLSWIERSMASRLYATPPTATLEEAIADFEETERLRPCYYAANLLYLAKCCISQTDYATAASWLSKAKELIDRQRLFVPHLDDLEIRNEIETLYPRYISYL